MPIFFLAFCTKGAKSAKSRAASPPIPSPKGRGVITFKK